MDTCAFLPFQDFSFHYGPCVAFHRSMTKECSMLFFGDNGQGDLMCAEQLTRMNVGGEGTGGGGMVSAAFIHQVRHGLHLDVLCCDLRGRNGRWIRYMEF